MYYNIYILQHYRCDLSVQGPGTLVSKVLNQKLSTLLGNLILGNTFFCHGFFCHFREFADRLFHDHIFETFAEYCIREEVVDHLRPCTLHCPSETRRSIEIIGENINYNVFISVSQDSYERKKKYYNRGKYEVDLG